jgi:phosphinothricin acetyltransferase
VAAGLWTLFSLFLLDQRASRALLLSQGFREVGIYEKHGKLDGAWRDVVIVERLLALPEEPDGSAAWPRS